MKVADRISEHVVRSLDLGSEATRPQASIGVAWAVNGEVAPETLVACADLAMYESKRQRDGAPVMWTADLDETGVEALGSSPTAEPAGPSGR